MDATELTGRHQRWGWWSLLVFLTLGIVLEGLHGFKVRWYLDVANDSRRLMLTLAHAHGVLLALVHIGFAATIRAYPQQAERWKRLASPTLIASSVLLPGGFFAGGLYIYGGDPGLGVLLVPIGGLALAVSVFLTARAVGSD